MKFMGNMYRLTKTVFTIAFVSMTSMLLMGCGSGANLIDRLQSPFGHGFFGVLILFLAVSAVIELVNSKRGLTDKLVWVFVVVFFPIGGFIIYRLFGHRTKY